ncbi:MAG: hypothetical protein M3Y85_08215 [Bacteroidota bacterium]|nr:hypothetical protein [Bacteroidota bacterium]
MYKLLILLFVSFFAACNNASTPDAKTSDSATKPILRPADSIAREAEMNFIDGCVENAKLTLGEAKAYTFCKCVFAQVKAKYPVMDSTVMTALSDTAEVARMAANCR